MLADSIRIEVRSCRSKPTIEPCHHCPDARHTSSCGLFINPVATSRVNLAPNEFIQDCDVHWIDRKNGIGGFWGSQILPFQDCVSYPGFVDFEAAVYRTAAEVARRRLEGRLRLPKAAA